MAALSGVEQPIVQRLKELAPYPAGPMPTNDPPSIPASQRWTKKRWQVYVLLHSGYTTRTAAAEVGYHPGTVERLRKDWKIRFGINIRARVPEECLSDPNYAKPLGAEEAAEQTELDHHLAALQARSLVQRYLARFTDDTPESQARMDRLTPAEVKTIQEIGLSAERAARGELSPAKGRAAAKEPAPASSAQKAVQGLTKPVVRKGRKGEAAESASSTAQDLRSQLLSFRKAMSAAGDDEAAS